MRKKKKSVKSAGARSKSKLKSKAVAKKATPKKKKLARPRQVVQTADLSAGVDPPVVEATIVITHEMIVEKAREIWARKVAIAQSNYDDQNWREAEAELRKLTGATSDAT